MVALSWGPRSQADVIHGSQMASTELSEDAPREQWGRLCPLIMADSQTPGPCFVSSTGIGRGGRKVVSPVMEKMAICCAVCKLSASAHLLSWVELEPGTTTSYPTALQSVRTSVQWSISFLWRGEGPGPFSVCGYGAPHRGKWQWASRLLKYFLQVITGIFCSGGFIDLTFIC
jgi:hypothetical protein